MANYCYSLLNIKGEPSIIKRLEAERFTMKEWTFLGKKEGFWGLDFEKVRPTPRRLLQESDLGRKFMLMNPFTSRMLDELQYPSKKTRPTVKKALEALAKMPGLLPKAFKQPKNLEQVLAMLKQTYDGRCLLFLNLISRRNLKRYGQLGLMNWRLQHWGCSGECLEFEVLGEGQYKLHTAWNPPILIIQTLAELYPELEIELKFLEEQMLFAGISSWKAGRFDSGEIVDAKTWVVQAFDYSPNYFE